MQTDDSFSRPIDTKSKLIMVAAQHIHTLLTTIHPQKQRIDDEKMWIIGVQNEQ